MPPTKTSFNPSLQKEFPFLKSVPGKDFETSLLCSLCSGKINIASRGRAAITDHLRSAKHVHGSTQVKSNKSIENFLKDPNDPAVMKLQAKELAFAYHTGKHRQSMRTSACNSKLIRECFETAFTCGKTKTANLKRRTSARSPFVNSSRKSHLCSGSCSQNRSFN